MASPSPQAGPSGLAIGAFGMGLLLAIGAFALVPGGEVPRHDAELVRKARVIDPARPPADAVGRLVVATGPLAGAAPLGDALLKPGPYLAIERKVERYASKYERVLKKTGENGPSRWVTELKRRWVEVRAEDPPVVAGIGAKAPLVRSGKAAVAARIGALSIDLAALGGPGLEGLRVWDDQVTRGEPGSRGLHFGAGTASKPHEGDLLVRYWAKPAGKTYTVVGKLAGPTAIAPFPVGDGTEIHRLVAGDRADVLAAFADQDEMGPAVARLGAFLLALPALALMKVALDAWLGRGRRLRWWGVIAGAAAGVAAAVLAAPLGELGAIAAGLAAVGASHALLARRPPPPPPSPRPLPLP